MAWFLHGYTLDIGNEGVVIRRIAHHLVKHVLWFYRVVVSEELAVLTHLVTEPFGLMGSAEVSIVGTKLLDCMDEVIGY